MESGKPAALQMEVSVSQESPLVNPAFIIQNWGEADARLIIDGFYIGPDPSPQHFVKVEDQGIQIDQRRFDHRSAGENQQLVDQPNGA